MNPIYAHITDPNEIQVRAVHVGKFITDYKNKEFRIDAYMAYPYIRSQDMRDKMASHMDFLYGIYIRISCKNAHICGIIGWTNRIPICGIEREVYYVRNRKFTIQIWNI